MSSETQPPTESSPQELQSRLSQLKDEGKKALALKEWNEASEKFSQACEITSTLHGELSPQLAPLLLSMAKAIFEIGVSQQGVLGAKGEEGAEQEEKAAAALLTAINSATGGASGSTSTSNNKPSSSTHTFAPEEEDEDEEEDPAKEDLGAAEEPEDEFNEAWDLLETARGIYVKEIEAAEKEDGKRIEGEESLETMRRNLGEVYTILGDVSMETENFPQAVEDFKSALSTFLIFLPKSAQEIASAHFKLAIALDLANDRKGAITEVDNAIESVESRLKDLRENKKEGSEADLKGGEGLLVDLRAKLDDLKTAPQDDVVHDSIAALLGQAPISTSAPAPLDSAPINNLTGMVKKKAKKTADTTQATATEGASQLQNIAVALVSKAEDVAADAQAVAVEAGSAAGKQLEGIANTLSEKVQDLAGSAQEVASEYIEAGQGKATEAAEAIKAAASSAYADAVKDGSALVEAGQGKAAEVAEAIRSAATSAYDQIMAEGQATVQQSVKAVKETAEDVKTGSENLGETVTEKAQQAFTAAYKAGSEIADQIMEEGKETTKEAVDAVADTATDVMDGLETVGRAGKRKVEELRPEEVDTSKKARKE